MKYSIQSLLAVAIALTVASANAQEQTQPESADQADAPIERLVKEEAGQQVVETRIDGRLDSVRVKPRIGPEYFIMDRSGDGTLSSPDGGEMDSRFNIRTWKVGEW
jgi:hypothetical protein